MTHQPPSQNTLELGGTNSFVSVYTGTTCIGFIINRGPTGYEAITADERSIGLYPTQRDAAGALNVGSDSDANASTPLGAALDAAGEIS